MADILHCSCHLWMATVVDALAIISIWLYVWSVSCLNLVHHTEVPVPSALSNTCAFIQMVTCIQQQDTVVIGEYSCSYAFLLSDRLKMVTLAKFQQGFTSKNFNFLLSIDFWAKQLSFGHCSKFDRPTKPDLCMWIFSSYTQFQIGLIPIEMTGFCWQKMPEQR